MPIDAAVCMKCGHRFSTTFQQPQNATQPIPPGQQTQGFFIPPTQQQSQQGSSGYSIAALVLGIISVVFMCLWMIAIPCGILAIIFGYIGRGGYVGRGMSTAGLVLGIVGISIDLVFIFLYAAGMAASSRHL